MFEAVAAERIHSAIDKAWTADEERAYIESLSDREVIHVAVQQGRIVGLQVCDRWSSLLPSMAHVGQIGTFLLPDYRRSGLGKRLWTATEDFARGAGYRKIVIQVRASNHAAQAYYRSLGFNECGRLSQQVIVDGFADDEVLMELFL